MKPLYLPLGGGNRHPFPDAMPMLAQRNRECDFRRIETILNKDMKELEKPMYFGATPKTIEKAKKLRKRMTEAEKLLWERLNRKQIMGLRFRRQHPIHIFITDFYCHSASMVIELDGEIHKTPENKEYDNAREEELKKFGIEVIRFKNHEVINNIDLVISTIEHYVIGKSPLGGI